jgi:hypothetical protein
MQRAYNKWLRKKIIDDIWQFMTMFLNILVATLDENLPRFAIIPS